MVTASLLALGITGLYAALASGESPGISESGGFSQPASPVTIPLALPEPQTAAELAKPKTPASAPPAEADYAPLPVSIESAVAVAKESRSRMPAPAIAAVAADSAPPENTAAPADGHPGKLEESPQALVEEENWLSHDIKSGDTLAQIFSGMGLSAGQLHGIVNSSKTAKGLARIKPGEKIRVSLDSQNNVRKLVHEISPVRSLQVSAKEGGFEALVLERPLEHHITHTSGIIDTSLFASAQKAGLSDAKTMELANIFGWDIDFALEIRTGDQFAVVYQEDFLDGVKLRDGPILAAEFVNRGKTYRAVRYVDSNGRADYYTPEGKSVRKAFLRTPVKVARISSRFNLRRKHPILNRIRAHKGVDYAAPKGTPIRASGDGRIGFRGRKGGYGKTVIIEHGGGISTLYAHMSRYVRSKRKGSRVQQGDVIGYIGKTGLATGTHLHYEFRVNGVHRNPLTVKLPAAKPIASDLKADFERQIQPLVAQLDTLSRTLLARSP